MPSRRQDLCIDGHQVMTVLGLSPGPQVGEVLRRLTSMILDHPELNTHDGLYSTLHQLRAEISLTPSP